MKKFLLLLAILILTLPIYSEPLSLTTQVSSVYFGPHGLGFGFAPTGTNFVYYDYFNISPKLSNAASIFARLTFASNDDSWFGGYNYETGTPYWFTRIEDITDWSKYMSGFYFNPGATLSISFYQGFGTNPVQKSGALATVGLEYYTRYNIALEALDVNRGTKDPVFIDIKNNTYKEPFAPGNHIQAYPWLQDSRESWINSLTLSLSLDLKKSIGFGTYDGISFNASIEIAPSWLGNNVSMKYPTADYTRLHFQATQYLSLNEKTQDNGLNWLSIGLSHNSTYSYTTGSVIPNDKLPGDRFKNNYLDSLYITFNGPQFIAWDCYTDLTIGIYNYCYWGHIVNENPQTSKGIEWNSSLAMDFHMRLFGFMHFKYSLGYYFMRGISSNYPTWYQDAKVTFYISL